MKSVMCAMAAVLLAVPVRGENPPEVKPLNLKGVTFDFTKGGNVPTPVELKTAVQLDKTLLLSDDAGRKLLAKQVDFDKFKLVVFVWSGSGGDKLTGALVKRGGTAQFTYSPGATDDLRRHAHIFAVPKDAKVELTR